MKLFISWSGTKSKLVAQTLKPWLEDVFPGIDAFVSDTDVWLGDQWFKTIDGELRESHFGIICVTRQNMNSQWLNYEAGALANQLTGRVVPFLVDLGDSSQLTGPLTQFQGSIVPTQDNVWKLLRSINDRMETQRQEDSLRRTFDKWWADLDGKIQEINRLPEQTPAAGERKPIDMIPEILETVRLIAAKSDPLASGLVQPSGTELIRLKRAMQMLQDYVAGMGGGPEIIDFRIDPSPGGNVLAIYSREPLSDVFKARVRTVADQEAIQINVTDDHKPASGDFRPVYETKSGSQLHRS